jgi:hypothetical protein
LGTFSVKLIRFRDVSFFQIVGWRTPESETVIEIVCSKRSSIALTAAASPYDSLVATNRKRSRREPEYDLLDTGVFDDDRYFDVFVEYAKETPENIFIKIVLCNRGPESATLHVLPTLWFRNTWLRRKDAVKPSLGVAPRRLRARALESPFRELLPDYKSSAILAVWGMFTPVFAKHSKSSPSWVNS